jgi:4-amino-4-deoxy-L-arabinose transferase-like glycosyltransferase
MKTTLRLSWHRLLLVLLETTIILLLIPSFLNFVTLGQDAITFPFPIDYGEGPLLDQTMRLARFENIYRADLTTPPFTIANYPPLFVLSQVPFAWIFGPALWYGRLISWLGACAAGIILGLLVFNLTKDFLAALIGGLSLFAMPYVLVWAPLNRVDSLALGLSLTGLFAVTRWGAKRWGLILSAVLLVAATYTRQSYGLAAPFGAFIWLFSHKPRRRAFILTAWVAGLGLGLFLVLNAFTRGGFSLNVITANVNAFRWETVENYAREIRDLLPILLAVNLVFLALGWFGNKSWGIYLAYLVGASLSAVTIGKVGSNVNYLMEFCATLSLGVGLCLGWLGARPKPRGLATLEAASASQENNSHLSDIRTIEAGTIPTQVKSTRPSRLWIVGRLALACLLLVCLALSSYTCGPRESDFMIS